MIVQRLILLWRIKFDRRATKSEKPSTKISKIITSFNLVKIRLIMVMRKKLKVPKKVSRRLAQLAGSVSSDFDLIDVVVELDHKLTDSSKTTKPNQSRNEAIASRKESFARTSSPVEDVITQIGGQVIDKAWVNYTLRAKLPAKSLQRISELDEVDTLDSPQEIQSE